MDNRFDKILEKISEGKRFLVSSHVNPEGDAVGSLLGLTHVLRDMGKEVTPYLEDPVPGILGFLPGSDTIVHDLDGLGPFDSVIAVDCGMKARLGSDLGSFSHGGLLINLDHHATNDHYGDLNVVDAGASATGEVIYDLCKAGGMKISKEAAINLYVAIHTDTGSFQYSCTTAESLIKAGELVKYGADPSDISVRVYENYPPVRFRLLALVLSTLEVIKACGEGHGGDIATLTVSRDMFESTDADVDHADGFVNYARGIEGVEVGALFRECPDNQFKISLRSKSYMDVGSVAMSLGGGGHARAAGCTLKGTLSEVKTKVLGEVKEAMMKGCTP
ncbi:MAG: bifunctional oligoribonuclease/PAP phosphatase NrnA [Thermodesulfobacteriota bacterium]